MKNARCWDECGGGRVNRAGFTVTELMVVCAIIGLFGALLLSAMPRVMAEMRSSKCQLNLRQIGIASQLWTADHDGRIVPVFDPFEMGDPLHPNLWPSLLAPYMNYTLPLTSTTSVPVFICPEVPIRFGYGYNYQYLSWMNPPMQQWATYGQIAQPAATVMFTDNAYPTRGKSAWKPYVRTPKGTDIITDFRHPGKTANVLWVDGHVSAEIKEGDAMKDEEMWDRK